MTRHVPLRLVSKHITLETVTRTLHHAALLARLTQPPASNQVNKDLNTPLNSKVNSKFNSKVDSKFNSKFNSKVDSKTDTKATPQRNSKGNSKAKTPVAPKNPSTWPLPIAVLALNPHGGENGLFGTEERVIEQALRTVTKQKARAALPFPNSNIVYEGPLSADTAFLNIGARQRYQHVVACYHDQGLIPLKTSAGLEAANVTLGLPFIRTSVDHGTAFDIAGRNLADETSLLYALYQAWQLQTNYQTLRAPVQKAHE